MYPSHSNQMNGVPVKISEKYKPPKKLTLNQALVQRLANTEATQQMLSATSYDFNLERNTLQKLADWQQQRQQEIEARRERTRQRQEEMKKMLEEKQKRMLTAVSYPSAEELSSDDDDTTPGDDYSGGTGSNSSAAVHQMNQMNASGAVSVPAPVVPTTQGHLPFSPPSYFDKILEPTVMGVQHKRNKSIGKSPNINYSDFENESSPFDNVELKTINDLDILAQVWLMDFTCLSAYFIFCSFFRFST